MTRGRVLVLAPQPFYQDRGTPIAVRLVLEALSELVYDVDVLTFPIGNDLSIDRVTIRRTANPLRIRTVPVGFSLRKLLLDASLAGQLRRLLRTQRYTYVHAVEEAAFLAAVYARRAGLPILYDMQSCLPEQMEQRRAFRFPGVQPILRCCERWLMNHVDLIVGSTGLAEHVAAVGTAVPFREWRFPPAFPSTSPTADHQLRTDLGIAPDARIVLYSGTFEPYQGLRQLIEAVPIVLARIPNIVFVLVGSQGRTGEAVAKYAARAGVTDAVRLIGRQAREDVGRYLAIADLFVSPRTGGGNIPLKIFDYLAAERPIVATSIPAHRSILDASRAVLVDNAAPALARGILKVLEDDAYATRLSAAGRAYARQHFGWDGFVQKVREFAAYLAARGSETSTQRPTTRRQAA